MILGCLVAAGCAAITNKPTDDAITTAGPAAAAPITPGPAEDAVTPEPPSFAPVADAAADLLAEPPSATEPNPAPPGASTADIAPPSVVASASPAAAAAALAATAPSVVSPIATEILDLSSLATRLRRTKAISLLTKVAVKNESDDLLEQFRAYHTQTGITTLADLRRSYDSLFHRLHALLRDPDPPLARDIDRSRTAIWEFLADPRKFRASLMARA